MSEHRTTKIARDIFSIEVMVHKVSYWQSICNGCLVKKCLWFSWAWFFWALFFIDSKWEASFNSLNWRQETKYSWEGVKNRCRAHWSKNPGSISVSYCLIVSITSAEYDLCASVQEFFEKICHISNNQCLSWDFWAKIC